MMDAFAIAASFLALIAVAGWINAKTAHLPSAVAMMIAGVAATQAILALRNWSPQDAIGHQALALLANVDFPTAILRYLLAFLLFAGAMQVDLTQLRTHWTHVAGLASLGTLASTLIVGISVWAIALVLHAPLSLPWAIAFGALISPTDPVAVLAAVHRVSFSKSLKTILQGEALFNDGVGIVIFTAAVAIASAAGEARMGPEFISVLIEAFGAVALGAIAAWLVVLAMRAIDDYAVEVTLSLALATGVYALASALHLSAPIAAATAGLIVGNIGARSAMSATTQRYVEGFWTLIDDILNAVLFALFGLRAATISFDWRHAGLWALAAVAVLIARMIVIAPTALAMAKQGEKGAAPILLWGGMHGALSAALALLLPASPARDVLVPLTFAVVCASIVVQGTTFAQLARRYYGAEKTVIQASHTGGGSQADG